MYFNVIEGGKNLNYKLSIDTFNLQAPKWTRVHEKMTPIVLYRSNINPVQEADQNLQFKNNTLYTNTKIKTLIYIHSHTNSNIHRLTNKN